MINTLFICSVWWANTYWSASIRAFPETEIAHPHTLHQREATEEEMSSRLMLQLHHRHLLAHHLSSIICRLSPLRTGVLAVFIKLPLPLFVLSRVPQLHGVPSTPQASLRLFALASFHLTRPLHRNSRSHSRAAELNLHVFFYLSSSRTFRGVQTAVQTPGEFTYIHDCMCSGVPSTKALDILSI